MVILHYGGFRHEGQAKDVEKQGDGAIPSTEPKKASELKMEKSGETKGSKSEEKRDSTMMKRGNELVRLDEEIHLNAMKAEVLKQEMLSFIQKKRKEMEKAASTTSKLLPAVLATPPAVYPDALCQAVPRSQFVPPQSQYLSSHAGAPPPLPSIHRPTIWKLHKWRNWDSKKSSSTPQGTSYYESFLKASLDANNPETHQRFIIQDQLESSAHLQFIPLHSMFLHPVDTDNVTRDAVKDYSSVFSSLPPADPKKKRKKKKKKKKAIPELPLSDDSSSQSDDDETPRHVLLRSISHAWRKYARRLKETPVEAGQLSLDATERIFFRDRNCPLESRRRLAC